MRRRDPNKPKRNIWTDTTTAYGTYEGERGNIDQWKKTFEYVKLTREEALTILGVLDPYEVLGLEKGASQAEVRKAMAKMVLSTHTDKGGDRDAFQKIMAAYEIITEKNQKQVDALKRILEVAGEVA
ncbi:MAG: DnaJ domain-containing protein [Candidatus Nanoarchaeia archaeon]|jgi:DnaJ-domain-containing protein 1|nr:DnaJ domain-containing protein [Candidatus Nanoarchaeia archaeon]